MAALDYGIEEAKRIKNWGALIHAVDDKIEELQKFEAWWRRSITKIQDYAVRAPDRGFNFFIVAHTGLVIVIDPQF